MSRALAGPSAAIRHAQTRAPVTAHGVTASIPQPISVTAVDMPVSH